MYKRSKEKMAVPEVELKPIVEKLVREFLVEFVKENELKIRELSLMERIVRVEEELKALREIQIAQFEAMEKRFEALQREMDKRFEALQREMDKRFEALQREMDKRFEAIEKRFEALQREMNKRFEAMEKRFEALQREMDKRFEAMEVRFEAIDKRFEAIEKRLNFMQWFIGIGFTIVSILIALFSFVGK